MTIANIQDHERFRARMRLMDTDAELRAAIATLEIVKRAEVLRTDRSVIDLRIPFDSYDALLDALYDAGLIVDGEVQ